MNTNQNLLRDKINYQIQNLVSNQIWYHTRDKLRDQFCNQVRDQVANQVIVLSIDRITDQVWDQVWNQLDLEINNHE